MNRLLWAAGLTLTAATTLRAQAGASALGHLVQAAGNTTRVLVIAAHPDDEDTRLITLLAKRRHVDAAYLSLTRGDGGQNLIGNELGEALGAIRTEELLAARRVDGGRQFFARAFDFGFSKSAEETFRHWPHDSVLGDAVRTVRAYRPQVVIAIWSGTPADGHGHHQASGIIAREAYDASADTVRFPAAAYGAPWAVPKFYRYTGYRQNVGATLRYDASAYDHLTGASYANIAVVSRDQHKSQGQGALLRLGPSIVSMRRDASRVNAGTPPEQEKDLLDGVDTTWARFRPLLRGAEQRAALDSLPAALAALPDVVSLRQPARGLPALLRARALLDAVCGGPRMNATCAVASGDPAASSPLALDLQTSARVAAARLRAAIVEAAGVAVDAAAARQTVAQGDTVSVTVTVASRDSAQVTAAFADSTGAPVRVAPGDTVQLRRVLTGGALTRPWWLERPRDGDMFTVPVDGRSEDARTSGLVVPVRLTVGGAPVVVEAPVRFPVADAVKGDVSRPLAVVPAVSVRLDHALQYVRAGAPLVRALDVHLRAGGTTARTVTVRLSLPPGLTADSAARTVTLAGYDSRADLSFTLRGTPRPGRQVVRVVAESGDERFSEGYELLDYDHIRPLRLYRPSEVALQAVDVALPPKASIAYVQGVGDNVAPMLAQLGLTVTTLDAKALATTSLGRFTAVVIGQRAYDANDALLAQNPRLLAWVAGGGTLVVQGGQYEMMQPGVMPYPVTIGRPAQRVTHPEAPVTIVEPALLAGPNRITAADFADWVQERARYIPATFDSAYHAPLSMSDPGEPATRGTLLIAPFNRGTYVYTSLSFFRQLPAGNPGAARLFVNLLAAKAPPARPRQTM